jgi:hypothetical protein
MIENGGIMKFGGRCENVKLQMGEYHFKTHMFVFEMGGCNVVLRVEWLQDLGLVTVDFKDIYMRFTKEGKKIPSNGLHIVSLKLSPLIAWRIY